MKSKKRLIWCLYLIFVLGTALFAFYEYRQSQQEQKEELVQSLIFPNLKPMEVQSVTLKAEKPDKTDEKKLRGEVRLFRKGKAWSLGSPVEDIADRDIVGDWLSTLLSEKVQLLKEEGADWAEYGLDKGAKTIEITTTYEKKLKVNISHYSAFDGSFYIQKEGALLLGGTGWASLTSKKGDYFRSYKLVNETAHPVFIEYHSPDFLAHFKWEDHTWKWENSQLNTPSTHVKGQGAFPLSQAKLESYWSALKNISFEKETYPDVAGFKKKFKLDKPITKLRVGFQNGDQGLSVLEIKVGPKIEGQFYVSVSNREDIFILSQNRVEELSLTEKKIRDHSHYFQFDREKLAFMDIKGYGMDLELEKKGREWKWLNNKEDDGEGSAQKESQDIKKEPKLNTEQLAEVLAKIPQLSAEKYFPANKPFQKVADLILKDKEGEILLHLKWSKPFDVALSQKLDSRGKSREGSQKSGKKSEDQTKNRQVLVKSHLGREAMVLPYEVVPSLFSPSLLQ